LNLAADKVNRLPFRHIFISGSWLLSSRIRSQHCCRIFSENKAKRDHSKRI